MLEANIQHSYIHMPDGEAYSEIPADHSCHDTNVRAQDVKTSPGRIYVNAAGIVGEQPNQVQLYITNTNTPIL